MGRVKAAYGQVHFKSPTAKNRLFPKTFQPLAATRRELGRTAVGCGLVGTRLFFSGSSFAAITQVLTLIYTVNILPLDHRPLSNECLKYGVLDIH